MPIFDLIFLILLILQNSEASPDTIVHVHIPPEQGGQVEIVKKNICCHMAKQCFVMIIIIIFLHQKDQPLIPEEIKYLRTGMITAKTQQIQKQFLEQLKYQEVQKQWNR